MLDTIEGQKLVETPFGNMVATWHTADSGRDRFYGEHLGRVHLVPAGELTEIPVSTRGGLDLDALEAEAKRLIEAGTIPELLYRTPACTFTINRKHYWGEPEINFHQGDGGEVRAIVTHYAGLGEELSDSARGKLADWAEANLETLKGDLEAGARLRQARYDAAAAERAWREAGEALQEAAKRLAEANEALSEALGNVYA